MISDEPMTTTATTDKPMPQQGGKYADHEFVKVASKVIEGIERAPYNKFETILVNYDKMKDIKGKRKLTNTEQRIYDRTDKLIQKEFDAMFKKADTMLDQLDRKTSAQQGGAGGRSGILSNINIFKPGKNNVNPDPATAPAAAATPATTTEKVLQPAPDASSDKKALADAAAIRRMNKDATGSETGVSNAAAAPVKANAAVTNAAVTNAAVQANAAAGAAAGAGAGAASAPAPAPAAPTASGSDKDIVYMDSNRFYRWIVSLLQGIWKWIKDLFMGAFNEKFEDLKKEFSVERLLSRFDTQKLKTIENDLAGHIGNIQRLVATGIGGAASASIDMILNAFSMSPVFGTTILVWRMFQNMLMIMGASLSVQAANNTLSSNTAKLADPTLAKSGGAKDKAKTKNNITKRLKTDIRQLNRSLKRYMHFPRTTHKGSTINGLGSGYNYM
jgi:hypothetical protein